MNPNDKEIKCIEFASKFYPKPKKLTFFERLGGKKEETFDAHNCEVSEIKTFSRFWADYGLRDWGLDFTYRKSYWREEKIECLVSWVKILYNIQIDIAEIEEPLIEENKKIREEFYKEESGGHIATRKTEDMLPEIIDNFYGPYQ
jgi:hypothetical protein